jgi:hypothetical protein
MRTKAEERAAVLAQPEVRRPRPMMMRMMRSNELFSIRSLYISL